jgi:alkylhydroperoxidase family enzyme
VLAKVPAAAASYTEIQEILRADVVEPELKELCMRYVAEDDDVVAHAQDPERFDERTRTALAWANAAGWNADEADDALWERLHEHFSEPELVEIWYAIQAGLGWSHLRRAFAAGFDFSD